MKLLVNATSLMPPLSGIGHYTQQLLLQLYQCSDIEEINAFIDIKHIKHQQLYELVHAHEQQNNTETKKEFFSSYRQILRAAARHIPLSRLLKQKIQQQLFKKTVKQFKDHIYWESNYISVPFDGYTAATIYDLSHIRYPQYHPSARVKWLNKQLPETIETAHSLITISQFSKQEIISYFNVPEDKISIVPPAVSPAFRCKYNKEQLRQLKQQLNLPEHYILSVGTLEPRKNLTGLVQAYSLLSKSLRKHYPLVIVGARGWHTNEIDKLIKPFITTGQIIMLGYVAQQQLPLLYAAADVFAYPSHYEGYGMPIAEAMCSNTAVLTSNVSAMPEVAAGSALLVNPDDIDQMAEKLTELLEDQNKRAALQTKGRQISDSYRWENSAEILIKVLNNMH